jgi:hypothetical protein
MLRDETSLPGKIHRTQLYLPTHQEAGVEEFSKNLKAAFKFRVHKCDMQQVPYYIRRRRTKFSCNKDVAPGIFAP